MNITKEEFILYFKELLKKTKIKLKDKQIEQFYNYALMLISYNKKVNLTTITEPKEIILKHFIDSIIVVNYMDFSKIKNIIDVGTGAGFPGIPLKIMFPDIKITLLDSLKKRLIFLDKVIEELGLEDIETIHYRAEDAAHNVLYREKYDLCLSRAVSNLSTLLEYTIPFIKIGGIFISYKSVNLEDEFNTSKNAMKILGAKSIKNVFFDIEGMNYQRAFVIIEKMKKTKKQFPRKAGIPLKQPLK